jgi:hypothetical protein
MEKIDAMRLWEEFQKEVKKNFSPHLSSVLDPDPHIYSALWG